MLENKTAVIYAAAGSLGDGDVKRVCNGGSIGFCYRQERGSSKAAGEGRIGH